MQKVLLKLLDKARAALMAAHAKNAVSQGAFKRFSTKVEKADQEACNTLVESGEIPPHLAFIAQMSIPQLEAAMIGLIPIVKLDKGKYLIGTEVKSIQIKNDSLLVRVGGGYVTLEEHIEKVARYECLKINNLMKKKQLDFKGAVCFYLDQCKASPKVKERFLKSDNSTIEAFNATMKVLEKRQEQSEARMKRNTALKKQSASMSQKI